MQIEVLLGDKGDSLVTFASPGEGVGTMKKTGTKYKDKNRETSGIQVSTSCVQIEPLGILFGRAGKEQRQLHCHGDER
jgi:hypothetical protein